MGFMDKFKSLIETGDEDDDFVEETVEETADEAPARPAAPRPVQHAAYETKANTGAPELDERTKMVLFEPRNFNEAETVGARLKEGRAVVVNLHKLDKNYARRTIDFLSGVVYALEGSVQKIGPSVILCYPKEIGVAGSISFGADDNAEDNIEE
ncbi:cell division protein SepF [Allobaculum mucilyticum]|uniref:cell division protein SepF n=2 Tax=Allobaculum mucilyticum TaxID=2834459 RepID=UPI001E52A5D7|nr:cell division protein SepF [Allobaculum mucilyticum]UNT96122.1 cell division protein SepF [Allobaculum mucilyticum]